MKEITLPKEVFETLFANLKPESRSVDIARVHKEGRENFMIMDAFGETKVIFLEGK